MIRVLKAVIFAVLGLGLLFFIVFFFFQIAAHKDFKKRALNYNYQRMNYKTFISTHQLFPERYKYHRDDEGYLYWLTYKVIEPRSYPYSPITSEYYILFNFKDWYKVDGYLLKYENNEKKREVSERETNVVLEDLQRLCRREIEKAEREVSDALSDMDKAVASLKAINRK